MTDYIKCPENIKICVHLHEKSTLDVKDIKNCNAVSLRLAILCTDGKYRFICTNDMKNPVYVRLNAIDVMNPDVDKLVGSVNELTEYFCRIKPTDCPSVAMRPTHCCMAYWSKVSQKGTIKVTHRSRNSILSRDQVDIPLPNNNMVVDDGTDRYDGTLYMSCTHWDVTEAMSHIWRKIQEYKKTITEFCLREKAKEEAEYAVGVTRLDALLKFQEQAKSIEEKISSKWNSMSTDDKALALKLIPTKKATAKSVKKKK
jgi:hypothetical protein